MADNAWYERNDDWICPVGIIGAVVVQTDHEASRDEGGMIIRGHARNYSVWWYEQESPVYGEGLAMGYGKRFPLTDEGLLEAKQSAIEWARKLLTEALEGLPSE
jgi:hypothetical protein